MSPVSRWAFVPALLGLCLIAWGTGWPIRMEDAFFPWTARQWVEAIQLPLNQTTREWKFFLAGVPLAVLVAVWWLARFWIGIIARCRVTLPSDLRRGFWRPMLCIFALLLLSGYIILAGQVRRIGHEWAAAQLRAPSVIQGWARPVPIPVNIGASRAMLHRMFRDGGTLPERLAALKLLIELGFEHTDEWLREVVPGVADADTAAWAIRALVMSLNTKDIPLMERFLDDDRPLVREAALDGLGILSADFGSVTKLVQRDQPNGLACTPHIDLRWWSSSPVKGIVRLDYWGREIAAEMPSKVHARVKQLMLSGQTARERQAAARVLVPHPPDGYDLRLAEWGVWLGQGGNVKLVQAELAGIPPFVHRTGNPIAEFKDRIGPLFTDVYKPVIHLTASEPMAVDLVARIRCGRPWFAYPRPDDFDTLADYIPQVSRITTADEVPKFLSGLDAPTLGRLPENRAYPWLIPGHAQTGRTNALGLDDIAEVGVRWQSLIVSPKRLTWMRPVDVPPGQQYAWWSRLRETDSSWVSIWDETERFLYYDGPTLLKTPLQMALRDEIVHIESGPVDDLPWSHEQAQGVREVMVHDGALIVRVNASGIQAAWINSAAPGLSQPLADLPLVGPAVEARLVSAIQARGLNSGETAAMIDCWRETFFAKPGLRVLLLLSAEEYDALCPLTIRPRPTERARVGIVWYELTPTGNGK